MSPGLQSTLITAGFVALCFLLPQGQRPPPTAVMDPLTPPPAPRRDEAFYSRLLAPKYGAAREVTLWDGTRADLLTTTEAVEIDWAPHWAESIGQSLYYSIVTGKAPAVILLYQGAHDDRFVYRAQTVTAARGIHLYVEPTRDLDAAIPSP